MNTRISKAIGSLTFSLVVAVCTAKAQPNLISNGSFEMGSWTVGSPNPKSYSLPVGSTAMTGWTAVNAALSWDLSPSPNLNPGYDVLTAAAGNYFLDLTGYHDDAPYGGVAQTITTIAGQTYNVSFDLGSDGLYNKVYTSFATAPSIQVSVNGVPAYDVSTPANQLALPDNWDVESFSFTAASTSTALSFVGYIPGDYRNAYIGFDNVVVATVPEPSCLFLLLPGLIGCSLFGIGRNNPLVLLRNK